MLKVLSTVVLGFLALAACNTLPALPKYSATLNGANERPTAITTNGTGSATATVEGTTLNLKITYRDLSGIPTLAHIHGLADENGTAGVLCNFTDKIAVGASATAGTGTIDATCNLDGSTSGATVSNLVDGKFYINIHTAANKAGEIRGQLKLQ